MRKVLTTEEWIAKRRAKAAEQKKRSKPPKESKDAQITAYRKFIKVASKADYGSACHDPRGYEE